MKTYKELFTESKFNLAKASITPKAKEMVKDIEKLGWKIKNSIDFIVTSSGFQVVFTKGKERKLFKSDKTAEETIRMAKKELK